MPVVPISARTKEPHTGPPTGMHRGKAPPIDSFDGESLEVRFDDWLPMLQRAATWNGWGEEETLLQLAGHLRKRALLEWNLLGDSEKKTLNSAVEAMRERLDPGSHSTAVQDFRHARQREAEPVGNFILCLERIFRTAYGRDNLSGETRDALLHGQLQEGLLYQLMEAPAVSGAQMYTELCVAARNEEKRLEGLRRRQQFQRRPRTAAVGPPVQPPDHHIVSRVPAVMQDRPVIQSSATAGPAPTSSGPTDRGETVFPVQPTGVLCQRGSSSREREWWATTSVRREDRSSRGNDPSADTFNWITRI